MQVQFGGSWYGTIGQAAKAWAETALPDTSVVSIDENAADAAQGLESFWWDEALKIETEPQPEGTDTEMWRRCCRAALIDRIEDARKAT